MNRILVILLFLGVLNLYAQERTDLIDRHFEGEITKRAAGDSINTKQYIFVTFLKDKAIIKEEKLTITKQPASLNPNQILIIFSVNLFS